jgi:aminoglycoside/choline kinase family phosphotransferase
VSAALREPVADALRAWGLSPEKATLLAGDASTRRYFRVGARDTTHVVMDCGAPLQERHGAIEPVAFLRWQAFYRKLSIRVPEVRGVDRAAGAILLEDLGDVLLQDRVESAGAASCAPAYARAVEWGVRLAREGTQRFDPASCPDEDPLTPRRLALEMDLFLAHAARVPVPSHGAPLAAAASALDGAGDENLRDARTLLHRLCADVHGGDARPRAMALCHRDFHARNLLLVGNDVAVIDFQDTRRGPRAYDVASLAWDPYVTLPPSMIETLVEAFRPDDASTADWEAEVAPCAGQRLLKAAGSYAWLSRARGQQRYAQWLSPALARAHERLASWPPRDALWDLLRAAGALEA